MRDASVPAQACANCDTPFDTPAAPPRYCPQCGQETTLHPPSVAEFAHEFVGHYVALEGPLWSSLRMLVLHPGRITREYLAGRRRRYVLPLRLYLSASFLFFLAFNVLSHYEGPTFHVVDARTGAPQAASAGSSAAAAAPHERTIVVSPQGVVEGASAVEFANRQKKVLAEACGPAASQPCSWFERRSVQASRRWVADPEAQSASFGARLLKIAPYAVFLMLPIFSALLALAYRVAKCI